MSGQGVRHLGDGTRSLRFWVSCCFKSKAKLSLLDVSRISQRILHFYSLISSLWGWRQILIDLCVCTVARKLMAYQQLHLGWCGVSLVDLYLLLIWEETPFSLNILVIKSPIDEAITLLGDLLPYS